MKIGIDARLFGESGIGRYIRNLIFEIQKTDSKNEYFIFLLKKDFESVSLPSNFHKVEADFRWYTLAEQLKFPGLLKKFKLDLMHFPHFNVPIFYRGKFVVTIHDLIHQHHSMQRATTHGTIAFAIKKIGYAKIFKHAVSASQAIFVPSFFVKKDLLKEYNVDSSKVIVTYEGVEETFIKLSETITIKNIQEALKKFNVSKPFIFYVGNAHPHKNVEGLIKAFLNLRKAYKNLQLVLAGHDHYFWERLKKEYAQEGIRFAGFISDFEMVSFYKAAEVRVIPSFEEGFGIPVLESFACECPVVCSNISSLPEVGGEGAIYFDPRDIKDVEEKIEQVLNNPELCQELVDKGLERVKKFSWKKMTGETLEVYERIISS